MTNPTTTDEFVADVRDILDAPRRPARPTPTTNGQRRARREAAKSAKPAKAKAAKLAPKRAAAKAHADPARVRAYFETTGLSRKEIAAVLGKSTGLIAHVTRDTGDRWSVERFRAAVDAIERHLKAKRVERPIAEPMTTATLSMFFVPEGDVVEGEPKARKPRTRRPTSTEVSPMPMTVKRMGEIVVDATLHSAPENYTEEELEFRAKIEVDVADAERNGWIIDVPSDL